MGGNEAMRLFALINTVFIFAVGIVECDEFNQRTSLCSGYTYGCSYKEAYTSTYVHRVTKSRRSCDFLGLFCNTNYWHEYSHKTRTSYRMKCRACNVDCQVNNWGNWGACTGSCYDTIRETRTRSVWRNNYGNGAGCPGGTDYRSCIDDNKACKISNACYAQAARQSVTGNNGCQECNKHVSRTSWTSVSGGACNDLIACTKDDQCKDGACVGTAFTCKSCESCNGTGCTLNSGRCLISDTCYSENDKNPEQQYSQCQACKSSTSGIQWTPLTGISCNDGDQCTHTDKCTGAGLCVGTEISGRCSLVCQQCDGSSTCAIINGCLTSTGICGCLIAGTCYDNNAQNPAKQCQYCDIAKSYTSWTNYATGTNCNDGNLCTRNDRCNAGNCVSEDFTSECAVHTVSTNPCVSGTRCDGQNCLAVFHSSGYQCYANQDQCDYPTLTCDGTRAECRDCSSGSCVSVHPGNTPKPTTGVVLTNALIYVYKSGTSTFLSTVYAPDGNPYLMLTLNNAIKVRFQNFVVPCDSVTFDWRIVTAVGENQAYSQTDSSGSAGTIDINVSNKFTLSNGGKYKIKVTAKNVRNTASNKDSDLILVDTTSPVIGTIYDGDRPQPNTQSDITYQMSNSRIAAHWDPNTVTDSESGLNTNTYQIAVGTTSGGTNVNGFVSASANSGQINLALQHNTIYYVTLRIYNRAGLASTKSSNGVKVDTTNPVTGALTIVKNTTDQTQLYFVTTPTRRLVATLKGCNDPESGIREIKWTICTENVNNPTDTACNTAGYQINPCSNPADCLFDVTLPENDRILQNSNFQSGYSYRLQLIITNGALRTSSITSNKFITDYNAPIPGTVLDSLSADIDYQHVNTSISVNWDGFVDNQSKLDYCQLVVYEEYRASDERVMSSFSNVSLTGQTTVSNLVLITGKIYYPVIRCFNKAGLFTDVASDGVLVDAFPPVTTEIRDIRYESNFADESIDRDYQVLLTGIKTRWAVFPSVSGLASCGWTLSTSLQNLSEQVIHPTSTTYSHALTTNLTLYTFYYASVRCTSRAGLSSTATSDGIAPDNTYPIAGSVFDLCPDSCGLTTDIAYSPDDETLRFRWEGFFDNQSGIDFYEWNYDQDCSGFYLLDSFLNVGVSSEVRETLSLNHNTFYCITVKGVNGAGLKIAGKTNGVLIDTTAPKEVIVKDGDNPSTDIDYQSSDKIVYFTWPLITDSESYIDILEVGLGSSPNLHDTFPLLQVENATTSHIFGSLSLQQNQVYYAKVCATNSARLTTCVHSDGVLIDITQPTDGIVIHGSVQPGIMYQADGKRISAHWYGFKDLESTVDYFEWAIGTEANSTDIMNFTNVGSNVSFTRNIDLVNGEQYFVSVVCYNKAGLQIAGVSNGVTVDWTPPVLPNAVDVSIVVPTALHASWLNFSDPESPLWYYKWAIGTNRGGTQVQVYTNVGNAAQASTYSVDFTSGLVYYVSVTGRNRAGLSSRICSRGVLYDDSPPLSGIIRDGNGREDIDYQIPNSSLSVNWNAFTDDHSGIDQCHVGIGTTNTTTNINSYVLVPPGVTSYVFTSIALTPGIKYYVLVQCSNILGLLSTNSSNGITVDVTPPFAGWITTRSYQSSLHVIEASWNCFIDPESPIDSFSWSIDFQTPMNQGVQAFSDVRLNQAAIATNLSLQAFETYYVSVRAFNKVGMHSTNSSRGILIDVSPPNVGIVFDGQSEEDIDWLYSGTGVGAHWFNFSDNESGIHYYRWSIGTNPEGCQVQLVTSVTTNTSAYCQHCFFIPGIKYYVTVEVTNGVGLKSTANSDGFTVDLTNPEVGEISGLKWLSNNLLQVTWTGGSDFDSGPPQCSLNVVSHNGWFIQYHLQNLSEQTVVVNRTGCPYTGFVSVYVNCTNKAFLTATSPSASIDGTPPSPGLIHLSRYSANSFTTEWDGFNDLESIVRFLEFEIKSNGSRETVLVLPYKGRSYTYVQGQGRSLYGTNQTVSARAFSSSGLVSSTLQETFYLLDPKETLDTVDCCDISMHYTAKATIQVTWNWRNELNNKSSDLGYTYRYSIGTVAGGTQILYYTSVGKARESVCTDCLLLQGAYYYVNLHASPDGFVTYHDHQSEKFLIDLTPPVAGQVFNGITIKKEYFKMNELFSSTWKDFTDPDSPIKCCSISIIDSMSGNAIWMESRITSNGTGTITRQLPAWKHGHKYHTKVECENEIGLRSMAQSEEFTVDETPPDGGSVSFSILNPWNGLVNITGSWSEFTDLESGVVSYEWEVAGVGVQLNRTTHSTGTDSSFSSSVNLTAATKYELVINATNGAGLSILQRSQAIVYDISKPVGSYVYDGAGSDDIDFQFSTMGIHSTWGIMSDNETVIVDCVWYIGTEPGGAQLLKPQSVGVLTKGSCSHCVLTPGMTYYSSVLCYNSAGLHTVVSSDGVLIDPSPPTPGHQVYDGKARQDKDYQKETSYADCSWEEFSDVESGVVAYRACLGSSKSLCNIKEKSPITTATEWHFSALKLEHGHTYYCSVTGINAAGLSFTSSSDGVFIDGSAPVPGTVIESTCCVTCIYKLSSDCDCQYSDEAIVATWFDFYDSESGIVNYEWSIGTDKGTEDVMAFSSVGLDLTATGHNVALPVGKMIFVTVRAENGAKNKVSSVSDGIKIFSREKSGNVLPENCLSIEFFPYLG